MNPQMIKKLKKMQDEMQEAQRDLESAEFTGSASGVVVVLQGTKQVVDVKINDELLEEKELLQDAILIAINNAIEQIDKKQAEMMSKFAGGMGLPF